MAWLQVLMLVLVSMTMAGCELAGNIFQAGMWVGAIMIVGLVALVALVAAKIRG